MRIEAPAAASKHPLAGSGPLAWRGALALLFGVCEGALLLLAFRLPDVTATLLIWVLAGFVGLDGLATLVEAAGARTRDRWPLLVVTGIVGAAAGIMIVSLGGRWALLVFAWWAVLTGLLEMIEAQAATVERGGRRVVAVISLALGLLLLGGALRDGAVAVLAAAAYGLVVGILRLRAAARLARRRSG